MALANSIPMRWPSGPLEIAIRQKAEGFTPQARQTLEYWHTAPALDFLQGSPVNCLVVSWAAGLAEDAEQQRSMQPLVAAARQRNVDVVGWVDAKADSQAAIAAAKSAGLTAAAVQGFTGKSDFPVIPWGERGHAPWQAASEVIAITDNVWPGVAGRAAGGGGGAVSAGPTALPWLDSNGWFLQVAHAMTNTPLWILFDPPGKGEVVPARSYQTAVCDVEIGGGRWVISLDDAFRDGLSARKQDSLDAWKGLSSAVAFFSKHPEWKAYRSIGAIAVVSDFAGDNYDFSGELVNALSRRDLLCRVLRDSGKELPPLTAVKTVLRADPTAPSAALRKSLLAYVEQGGFLVAAKWAADGKPVADENEDFTMRALGKGRIAVVKQDTPDPWEFVTKAQSLVSHADDSAKLFNASASGGFTFTSSPDGKRALLQLLSYANYGGGGGRGGAGRGPGGAGAGTVPLSSLATAWTRLKYRSAQLWTLESAAPAKVEVAACEDGGTEYHLPAMSAYLALDFEV
ncbi:MAG TPA: hypothetical protein VMU19_04900 [Bryobacteraceae bacterium]|nr:hypothetical protein [Bryobacteraceae bacterium]